MDKKTHINFWYIVLAVLALLAIQQFWAQSQQVETIPYSEFQQLLKDGKIAEIGIAADNIRGKLKEPGPEG
ncbi:MAG: ATP-dependent metallopeptidase FtsH/Yme1/Tma family protein, partial [Gammaproteobacteria bacterium]